MTRSLGAVSLLLALVVVPVLAACQPVDYRVGQRFSRELTPAGAHLVLAANPAAVAHAVLGLSLTVGGPEGSGAFLVADDPTLDEMITNGRFDMTGGELQSYCAGQEICAIGLSVVPDRGGAYQFEYALHGASTFPASAGATAEVD
jgi:hypothetical protein